MRLLGVPGFGENIKARFYTLTTPVRLVEESTVCGVVKDVVHGASRTIANANGDNFYICVVGVKWFEDLKPAVRAVVDVYLALHVRFGG